MNAFAHVIQSSRSFEDTCIELRKAVDAAKWSLMGGYDFGEILASKGFPQASRIKSFDICNARHANEMLGAEILIAMCMPCSVSVIEQGDRVTLATVKPGTMMPAVFGDSVAAKQEYMEAIDSELLTIVNQAAGR
jgi:uncharacterized protein (DUF302 family)